MKLWTAVIALSALCIGFSLATANPPATMPSTTPATEPISVVLLGTFRCTVVDDEVPVPCLTTFLLEAGKQIGT